MPDPTIQPDRAKCLMRLGWALAELRGRVGFGSRDPGRLLEVQPVRTDHALPLGEERSPAEQLIEVKKVVLTLAGEAGLAFRGDNMKDANGNVPVADSLTAAQRVVGLADAVPEHLNDPSRQANWNAFTEALYEVVATDEDVGRVPFDALPRLTA
jgi:hypothetical protein